MRRGFAQCCHFYSAASAERKKYNPPQKKKKKRNKKTNKTNSPQPTPPPSDADAVPLPLCPEALFVGSTKWSSTPKKRPFAKKKEKKYKANQRKILLKKLEFILKNDLLQVAFPFLVAKMGPPPTKLTFYRVIFGFYRVFLFRFFLSYSLPKFSFSVSISDEGDAGQRIRSRGPPSLGEGGGWVEGRPPTHPPTPHPRVAYARTRRRLTKKSIDTSPE